MSGTTGPDRVKYLFIWPAFLLVLLITLFPLIYALTVSFQAIRIAPPAPPRFVGFDTGGHLLVGHGQAVHAAILRLVQTSGPH